jgi:proline iminopeptidase
MAGRPCVGRDARASGCAPTGDAGGSDGALTVRPDGFNEVSIFPFAAPWQDPGTSLLMPGTFASGGAARATAASDCGRDEPRRATASTEGDRIMLQDTQTHPTPAPPNGTVRAEGSGLLVAAGVAATAGLLAGWLLPRGPVTSAQALATVAVGLLVGAVAGWAMRSRWALLLAPGVFVLVFELARARVDGPTVDVPRLGDLYGLLTLLAGRGVDAVLMLLPMVVGTGLGLAYARRSARGTTRARGRWPGRLLLSVGVLAVLALLAGLLRPASTEPITDASGAPVPGSVAELVSVEIGGHEQWLMLRGVSEDAPVLLYLEGGPGGTGVGRMRRAGEDLEHDFVVATWDQRGTGKSVSALEPTQTLTVDQMVQDTLEVTAYLQQRFDEPRIYLVGSSWGTVLAVLAAQRSPESFHAVVGTGQMVDPFETDELMYAQSLADAEARGDTTQVETLREMGPPPYQDTLDYPIAIASNPAWSDFTRGEDYNPASEYPASLFVPEYTLVEQLRGMGAIADTFDVLYPQLEGVDFRQDVPGLDVPLYVVAGAYEAPGREVLAREWVEGLSAPVTEYVVFERSGHNPNFDEPGRFADFVAGVHREVGER